MELKLTLANIFDKKMKLRILQKSNPLIKQRQN